MTQLVPPPPPLMSPNLVTPLDSMGSKPNFDKWSKISEITEPPETGMHRLKKGPGLDGTYALE